MFWVYFLFEVTMCVQLLCHVQLFATCGLQHTSLPCPSLSPRVCSNSHPLSRWRYVTISASASRFSFCSQSLPASESFPMSWLFISGSQNIRALTSASVLPRLTSFRIDWFDLLAVQGTLKNALQHHSSKASILQWSAFFMVQLSHLYMTTGKIIALTRWTFFNKVVSLLFNILSRFAIAFLARSKCL